MFGLELKRHYIRNVNKYTYRRVGLSTIIKI